MGPSNRLKQSDGNVYLICNSTDNEYRGQDETLNATNKVLLYCCSHVSSLDEQRWKDQT